MAITTHDVNGIYLGTFGDLNNTTTRGDFIGTGYVTSGTGNLATVEDISFTGDDQLGLAFLTMTRVWLQTTPLTLRARFSMGPFKK